VFLDPPFRAADLPAICARLEQAALLDNNCLVYLESDKPLDEAALPANWEKAKSKKAGQVYYYLYKRQDRK
jgi:16S rRNA (guanine966-N2)-methyltransferase